MDFISKKDNKNEVADAIEWWKSGGISTFMWHIGAPGIGEGYENSKRGIEIDKIWQDGTVENKSFWDD